MNPRDLQDLIDHLESDDVQRQLKPGFQRDFATSIGDQWRKTKSLSPRQQEILIDIVERYRPDAKPSNFTRRRYEGFDEGRRR